MIWRFLGAALAACVAIFIAAPLLVVVIVSFNEPAYTFFPPRSLSLKWYWAVLSTGPWLNSIMISAWLGVAAASCSSVLGALAAFGLHRSSFVGRDLIKSLFISPIVFPGVLMGIALLTTSSALRFNGTFLSLLLAHILISLPYSFRLVLAALPNLDRGVEEAAATLGASPATILWTVTLPMIGPAIAAGALFAFIISFDNVILSIFLSGPRTVTLPVQIFSYVQYSGDPSIAAISTLFMLVTLAMVGIVHWFSRTPLQMPH
ncbi:hypothetical protein N182_37540 [Sinorhizobium sp. GL2]|nr:hypothetical protein N182_37540 [Sinorhizobium sp. GL2]